MLAASRRTMGIRIRDAPLTGTVSGNLRVLLMASMACNASENPVERPEANGAIISFSRRAVRRRFGSS